jgi:hypothetical protein
MKEKAEKTQKKYHSYMNGLTRVNEENNLLDRVDVSKVFYHLYWNGKLTQIEIDDMIHLQKNKEVLIVG